MASPDVIFSRLQRRIAARSCAQAVVRMKGRGDLFDLVPLDSLRLRRLLEDPKHAKRVVGVFEPSVTIETLRAEIAL